MTTSRLGLSGRILLALVCVLSLLSVAAAPSTIIWPKQLAGSHGGAFHFYPYHHSGGGRVVTIQLYFTPADPVAVTGLGFNLYGPNGYHIGASKLISTKGGLGVAQLAYAESKPTEWQIQVYNYLPGTEMSYTIVVNGEQLGTRVVEVEKEKPAPPVALPKPTTPSSPVLASGLLTGKSGGAFVKREVWVAEGSGTLLVTLNWSPDDASISRGVGLVAYGPAGETIEGVHADWTGESSVSLPRAKPGRYLVQVYNYMDRLVVGWVLKTTVVK